MGALRTASIAGKIWFAKSEAATYLTHQDGSQCIADDGLL
jgi:hypothetical protein